VTSCVTAVERDYVGGLAFGMTSCDPNYLRGTDLPDDSDLLLDRPEYWVVHKDVCAKPEVGDELSFSLTSSGESYTIKVKVKVKSGIAVHGTPSHSYGVSLAIWDHTVLPSTRHK